jgi:RNA polymerase sigma-70 factor (ECF subfamily)
MGAVWVSRLAGDAQLLRDRRVVFDMRQEPAAERGLENAAEKQQAWGAELRSHEERLKRMVSFRLDARMRGRVDAADIVQEVFLEALEHRERYVPESEDSLFLWLRGIATNKLLELHRRHLRTQSRDARREVSLFAHPLAEASSAALAAHLVDLGTRASEAAMRDEVKAQLEQALSQMAPLDREVLALKHFEQLTSLEVARVLGIEERAAAKRYLRALERLRQSLASLPGGPSAFAL